MLQIKIKNLNDYTYAYLKVSAQTKKTAVTISFSSNSLYIYTILDYKDICRHGQRKSRWKLLGIKRGTTSEFKAGAARQLFQLVGRGCAEGGDLWEAINRRQVIKVVRMKMLQPLFHLRRLLQSIWETLVSSDGSASATGAQTVPQEEWKEGENAPGEQCRVTQMANTHRFSTINEITEVCSNTSCLLCG